MKHLGLPVLFAALASILLGFMIGIAATDTFVIYRCPVVDNR